MSGLMEELIAEVRAEVREEVKAEVKAEERAKTAKRMLIAGKYSYEEIVEIAKLSLKEVETLANGLLVN